MTAVRLEKLARFINRLSRAVDRYVSYRVRRAVPEFELRRIERQMSRYRRQLHMRAH